MFLVLATGNGNDIYREAVSLGIAVERMKVDAEGQDGAEGALATNVTCQISVVAHASEAEIRELMRHTDMLAEIQNRPRVLTLMPLERIEAIAVRPYDR